MWRKWALRGAERACGTDYQKQYRAIKQIHNVNELAQFQAEKISELLAHAKVHVPYYRKIFNSLGPDEPKEWTRAVFSQIPLLTRNGLRANFKFLQSDDIARRKWFLTKTSGSTGEPVQFVHERAFFKWLKATTFYYHNDILGINESSCKKLQLWGMEPEVLHNTIHLKEEVAYRLWNKVLLNGFRMTLADLERYINFINRYKPELIIAYSSSLYELCRFAAKRNMDIYRPKKLICTGESLRDYMREQIESVFGTKVYDFYGSRDVGVLAAECEAGFMHLFDFWNQVEVLDDTKKRQVKAGQEGAVAVTNLFNYAMPLIRYDIGDVAVLGPKRCPCGNLLPTFERVSGRFTDRLTLEDGTVISGLIFTAIFGGWCNNGHFKQYQVIQEDYRKLSINVVLDSRFEDADRRNVESEIRAFIGDCKITWNFMDEIPPRRSGKLEYVKSYIST